MATPLTAHSTNTLTATGEIDPSQTTTVLRLADGRTVTLPTALLLQAEERAIQPVMLESPSTLQDAVAFSILEERLTVGKRTIETGKVTLEKLTHEYEETLDVPLAVRSFDIERVVLNQPVDTAPPVRKEGNTTIYPLVEEQLVLTTQLILKEELRVTQRDTERRDTRTVTLKRESIEVNRTPLA